MPVLHAYDIALDALNRAYPCRWRLASPRPSGVFRRLPTLRITAA
jgi:hypothetical protein